MRLIKLSLLNWTLFAHFFFLSFSLFVFLHFLLKTSSLKHFVFCMPQFFGNNSYDNNSHNLKICLRSSLSLALPPSLPLSLALSRCLWLFRYLCQSLGSQVYEYSRMKFSSVNGISFRSVGHISYFDQQQKFLSACLSHMESNCESRRMARPLTGLALLSHAPLSLWPEICCISSV